MKSDSKLFLSKQCGNFYQEPQSVIATVERTVSSPGKK